MHVTSTQLSMDAKRLARYYRVRRLRRARRRLPRGQRLRIDADGDQKDDYDGRKYPEYAPYKGKKGQV